MEDFISRLENKVLTAIETIQTLRREKAQIEAERDALKQQLQDVTAERQRMQEELAEARQSASQVERFEEKRRIIEEKVGGLLDKLEAMG